MDGTEDHYVKYDTEKQICVLTYLKKLKFNLVKECNGIVVTRDWGGRREGECKEVQ